MKVYCGYLRDKEKLVRSASGGAITAFSESILKLGGVVFGVRYSTDFQFAEYCCVDSLDKLEQIKGSKYTETQKNNVYQMLAEHLARGEKVLFTGLGCDVAAVKAYCKTKKINTSHLYTIDILCHGPAPKEVLKSYVSELEKKHKGRIKEFTIRYKKEGWTPFYIKAVFNDDKVHVEQFNDSDYGRAFYNIAIPHCTQCKFKGDNHKGDLCVGDYWGITKEMPGWNKNGVSAIVVQNQKGEDLLKILNDDFDIREADTAVFLQGNPMYEHSREQCADYQAFMNDLRTHGLHYAVSKLPKRRKPIRQRIKMFFKLVRQKD